MSDNYKDPQLGYVINDASAGTIFIGADKDTARTRQVEVHAASNACIKLFEDGGFEIQGKSTGKFADNIISECADGLVVKAKNIRLDAGNGEITFAARSIRYESTGSDQDLVIRSGGNIKIEAADTIRLDGSVLALGARTRVAIASKGSIYVKANGGFTVVEPQNKLIPTNLSDFTNILFQNIFPDYF